MFEKITQWFRQVSARSAKPEAKSRPGNIPGDRRRPNADRRKAPDPHQNVLIRNKYQREDTGTHETLKIVDDSLVDSGEETGIDPYNTGNFDRSRNWDKRFRN